MPLPLVDSTGFLYLLFVLCFRELLSLTTTCVKGMSELRRLHLSPRLPVPLVVEPLSMLCHLGRLKNAHKRRLPLHCTRSGLWRAYRKLAQ